MKTPQQDIDVNSMHQVAQEMLSFAHMLHQMEIDPNGTRSLTASFLMTWASVIFNALETKGNED